ncbi:MAG: discoidin domain-containing protein, partial [Treponema sp.]|nr:discoidin domain-containing protein [Treponema sp.]
RHWLTIDLGEIKQNITNIKLTFRNSGDNHVTDYEIYISDEDDLGDAAVSAKKIKSGTNSSRSGMTIELDTPASGRYIQLRCNPGDASTEQCIAEFQIPFEQRIEGFSDVDTSYLAAAFYQGKALLPGVTNPTRVKELSTLLEDAKDLIRMTTPENLNEKIIFQEQVDSVARPLIALVNSLAL